MKIIHEVAKRWDGQPAKNYGEKYLLIWKLDPTNEQGGLAAALEQNKLLALGNKDQPGGGPGDYGQTPGNVTLEEKFNSTQKMAEPNAGLLASEESHHSIMQEMDRQAKLEEELLEHRTNTADKELISAVKIVVELRRA